MATVSAAPESFVQNAAMPPFPVCRLSVEHYEEMIRAGIIMEDDPIELLDGWLVPKMTQNPPHFVAAELAYRVLLQKVGAGWCVCSQKPVRFRRSMPEPDVMAIRGDLRQYRDRLPRGEDIALVVEVADASLYRDRILKKTIYADAGIPVYWIVNVPENRVEVYTDPGRGMAQGSSPTGDDPAITADYRQHRDYTPDMEIPLILDGQTLASVSVTELLP